MIIQFSRRVSEKNLRYKISCKSVHCKQ